MKKLYAVLLSLLLVAVAAVGVYSLVDVDATESKIENRALAKKPAFTLAGLLDGSYISQLEIEKGYFIRCPTPPRRARWPRRYW